MPFPSVLSVADIAKTTLLAYNEKNFEKIRGAVTPRFVYDEFGTGRIGQGIEQALSMFRSWATAIPDSRATVVNEYVSGNTAVLEIVWTGTHSGPLNTPSGTIAPTGKRIEVPACQVVETYEDKTNAVRHYFDMATLLQQIGYAK